MAEEVNNSNCHLRELLEEIAKEQGYENARVVIKDISSDGANYSSTLHIATISAPPKEDLQLFAKVASISEAQRATSEMFTKAFDTEIVFYSELAVAFDKLYNKHGVPIKDRIYIPKYYGYKTTENKETLVLENLTASGFESFDRFKPFDWDYAAAAVEELAKFHALGIIAREENLEEIENIRKIGLNVYSMEDMRAKMLQQTVKMGTVAIKEEYKSRVKNYLKEETILDDLAIIWKATRGGFLIHSDYRPSNLMHRKKNGKVEVVPVDFQTLHFGTLVADLLYFIWCGSDSKFREKYYQQLLDHYYTELTIALKNLHIDVNKVYPRMTFEKELEDSKTVGLLLGLGVMSVLTVEPEEAAKLEDTMDSLNVEPNQLALERMNEVVADYIRWGII